MNLSAIAVGHHPPDDINTIIDHITAPMDRARSISSVLHGRLQRLELTDLGRDVTWAQRTPKDAPAVAHELAAGAGRPGSRARRTDGRHPEPWLAGQLGTLAPHASPALRRRRVKELARLMTDHHAWLPST